MIPCNNSKLDKVGNTQQDSKDPELQHEKFQKQNQATTKKTIPDPVSTNVTDRLKLTQSKDNSEGYVSEKHNSSGVDVKFWQENLKTWAINSGDTELIRRFSGMKIKDSFNSNPHFTALIKEFQSRNGLNADGIIGPRTFRRYAQMFNEDYDSTDSFTKYTGVTLLSESEYQTIISNISRLGYDTDYLPGIGETLDCYSLEDATLNNIPDAVKEDLLSASKTHGYNPQTILTAVNKACKNKGIPPVVILRIMQQESGFNPTASSSAGAQGLMQIMPFNNALYGISNPNDIEQNIRAGVNLFSDCYSEFHSTPLALAAYNAGSGSVQKYKGIPPFAETQSYVKGIMGRLVSSLNEEQLYKYAKMKEDNSDTLHQVASWDCGPTAHANMFGKMLGLDEQKLAATFRAMQGHKGMSWENPEKFKEVAEKISGKNIVMRNLGKAKPEELSNLLNNGWEVIGSFRSVITKGGHITNLSGVTVENGEVKFVNADPNGRNLEKGLGLLTKGQVDKGGRQFWAFKVAAS